jgi:SAM-dependent methyltransferase
MQANLNNAVMFDMEVNAVRALPKPQLRPSFLWEFLLDGRTPARAMTDEAITKMLPALEGTGSILELGAAGNYYKRFAKAGQRYVTSNLSGDADARLDMTRLDLPDNSVDALVSVFAIEHVFDFAVVFGEQYRVLKPGGRLLLVAPFLYYYHAAPDDYFRFSCSALDSLLSPFEILIRQPVGGRNLLFAEFLHEKAILGSKRNPLTRFALRLLALPFLAFALSRHQSQYAIAYAYVCQKKAT